MNSQEIQMIMTSLLNIDPDLVNLSSSLNIEKYLSGEICWFQIGRITKLAHIVGSDPNLNIDVFNEKDVISGMLISSQVKRKRIFS